MRKKRLVFSALILFTLFLCQTWSAAQPQEAVDILGKASAGVVTFKAWDNSKNVVGEGTGFALAENLVVVPYHLISQATEAEVTSISGKSGKVEALVATYKDYDLALVRIKGKVNGLSLGVSTGLKAGDRLFALSEISGQVIITEGNLRNWLEISPGRLRVMEVTMNLEKPACGAPIFDVQGQVVGVALVFGAGVKFGVPVEAVSAMNTQAKGQDLKGAAKENYLEQAEGSFLVGKSAALMNEPGMGSVYLEKYLKFKPDDLEGYVLLGQSYFKLGNTTESYKNFAKALLLNPDHAQALYGMGLTQLRERKFKEAAEFLEKAISNRVESKEIYFELGTAYEELQDLARAAENYEKYARSGPANPFPAWLKLAQTYQRLNQPEKAIAAFREALKINPDDINCNYNLAKMLAETNQLAEAEEVFKKLATRNQRDAITYYGQIMQMYDRAQNYEKAVEAARKIVEINPKNEVALYNLAIMYDRLGKLEEAASTLNECLAVKSDYTHAWFNLGIVYDKMKKHAEAVEAFKKYTALAPDDPSGWLNIGLEYMLMKDFEKALPNLEKSVSLNPNNAVAQYNLGITYINLKDNYSAREVLKTLQRLDQNLAGRLAKLIK
ncbi:MAG: tetratricopeptide repeat protein [Candidatus Saccharicenans sp.]|nr:tetratricopeptide repeat protein [Candidatus Saccharicenans sp.]MDH7574168.1 tetratricopeptide repeat protein [Candidatus Saccharicenans sp.]